MDFYAGLEKVKREVTKGPGPFLSSCGMSATTGQALPIFSCQGGSFSTESQTSLLHHAEVHCVPPPKAASGNLQERSDASLHRNRHTSETSSTEDVGVAATSLNCDVNSDVESTSAWHNVYIETALSTSRKKYFACHLCPYNSNHKDAVVRHIRTHTKERPFKCNLCSSSFIRKHHLTKHITSVHTDQNP